MSSKAKQNRTKLKQTQTKQKAKNSRQQPKQNTKQLNALFFSIMIPTKKRHLFLKRLPLNALKLKNTKTKPSVVRIEIYQSL